MAAQNDKPDLFVVDGSNIATEGRSKPSLEQLNEAVAAFREQYPDVAVTVVVDATFGHRIAKKEVKAFDKAVAENELVTPPAGAVGRGDAFILAIADKARAGVFSNDSFQEFHGEYEWLFDSGRLIGGKPVPHVGWVFVDRNPVRGRRSREAVRAAKLADSSDGSDSSDASPTDAKEQVKRRVRRKKKAAAETPEVIEAAVERAVSAAGGDGDAPTAAVSTSVSAPVKGEEINDLVAFLDFVETNQVGGAVSGVVDSYSSHGAYARVGDVRVYIPLRQMSDPPPTSARKLLTLGDQVDLIVTAFIPERRSIDAALPAMASTAASADGVHDEPSESEPAPSKRAKRKAAARKKEAAKKAAAKKAAATRSAAKEPAAKKRAAKKPAAKKPAAKKDEAATNPAAKSPAANTRPAAKKPAARKNAAKKKAAAKKPAAKKAAARRKPAAKQAAGPSDGADES